MQRYSISQYGESVGIPGSKGISLDTLVQPGTTALKSKAHHLISKQVGTKTKDSRHQSGCDCGFCDGLHIEARTKFDDRGTLLKRARRKYLTGGYIGALVDAAKLNGESELTQSYWNTWHCSRTLTLQSNGNISGSYCKNRWCLVCNAIRTAQLIKRYSPTLEEWQDKHFVTLTIPNVEADDLPGALELMYQTFLKCKERLKKRSQRGQCPKFEGLRKLECTYNPERNDFHPHFHVIVSTAEAARQLYDSWLDTYNKSFEAAVWGNATPSAQDLRPATDGATMELFKYFTKVIQGSGKEGRLVYADALDKIFNAVKGKRVFQPFGFTTPPAELTAEEKTEAEEQAYALAEYTWDKEKSDWAIDGLAVDPETGEVMEVAEQLTNYQPGDALRDLVENKVVIRPGHSWKRYAKPRIILYQGGQVVDEEEQRELKKWIDRGNRLMQEKHQKQRRRELSQVALQTELKL